jgi:hypothetical protein
VTSCFRIMVLQGNLVLLRLDCSPNHDPSPKLSENSRTTSNGHDDVIWWHFVALSSLALLTIELFPSLVKENQRDQYFDHDLREVDHCHLLLHPPRTLGTRVWIHHFCHPLLCRTVNSPHSGILILVVVAMGFFCNTQTIFKG